MAANFFNKRFRKKGNHFFELNSLNNSARGVSRVFFIVTIANIVAVTTFFILALATQNTIFTLILAVLFVLFIAFVALTLVFYFKYSFSAYFSNLYNKTRENYAKLANFEKNLGYFKNEKGELVSNCECMLVSDKARKKGWLILAELKYCGGDPRTVNENFELALSQVKETFLFLLCQCLNMMI